MKSTCFHLKDFMGNVHVKRGSPSGKGVLEMRSVCTALERGTQANRGLGAALSPHRPCPDPELEGTCKLRLG